MFPGLLGEPFGFKHTKTCLDGKVAKRLLAEANEAFPVEYSALLAGRHATITAFVPMLHAHSTPDTFRLSGPDFLQGLRRINEQGLQWLGVLHSHPSTPAIPSLADAQGWHYPQLGYWIVSLADDEPQLKLYQWTDGGFAERPYLLDDAGAD
ncbi:M67 family metallopeptidase [Brevibacillus ruminantium]|uniref:M67 family metallopeptidase n=1 Tax=Brevibacillus ruminantium TaxID=2950604 RepID=A0ABY4WI41_9BACL|nr:M67 family metallopeptidase [Brevibacillus ruminantium]USG66772.1 M67 family metallopeptidase [Brevibacillus ruminantium]